MNVLDVKNAIVIDWETLEKELKKSIVDVEDCIIQKSDSEAFYCMGHLRALITISGNDYSQDEEYLRLARMIHLAFGIDMDPNKK